jgi:hypothetical protein
MPAALATTGSRGLTMRLTSTFLLMALFTFASAWKAVAGSQTWTGGTSTAWTTAANWNSGLGPVPASGDSVTIGTGHLVPEIEAVGLLLGINVL